MRRPPFLWADRGYSQGMLHVIIPTLNAGTGLTRLLPALLKGGVAQIWVADGGSDDATLASAGHCGARILSCPPGRGRQLSAGAEAALQAGAGWLLFLHADSTLPEGWADLLTEHRLRFPGHAAAFALRFDDPHPLAAVIAGAATLRSRWLGLPWGDQGLFLPASLYRAVGGYRPLPLMEDVDLVRRIGRRQLRLLPAALTTGADRYRRDGWIRRPLKNAALLLRYALGEDPQTLADRYRR